MKHIALALLFGFCAWPLAAQTVAATGNLDFDAERARLSQQRKTVEDSFALEQAACYKKFAVEGCLEDSRKRRRAATDDIKRQEASINDIDRKRRGAAELDKLDSQKATPRAQDGDAQRAQSQQSQEGREQRAADHSADRTQAESEAAARRRAFEAKQEAHAEDVAKAAKLRAEAPSQREAYERKLQRASDARADQERRNAANTKTRSAPLPPPERP